MPGRPPRVVPALGASSRSHKGGNDSEKGSAWSRSPSEEVGVWNRTHVLATPRASGNCLPGEVGSGGEEEAEKQAALQGQTHGKGCPETMETETVRTERDTEIERHPSRPSSQGQFQTEIQR